MDNTDAPAATEMEGVETTAEAGEKTDISPGTPPLESPVPEAVEVDQKPSVDIAMEDVEATKLTPTEASDEPVPAGDASAVEGAGDETKAEVLASVGGSAVVKSEDDSQLISDAQMEEAKAQEKVETPVEVIVENSVETAAE